MYFRFVPIIVKPEHIQKGIDTYNGKRDLHLETLLKNGNLDSEVYKFQDDRYLVNYKLLGRAFLYKSKDELMNSITLT
jgi:hypothetical protein